MSKGSSKVFWKNLRKFRKKLQKIPENFHELHKGQTARKILGENICQSFLGISADFIIFEFYEKS